MSKRTFEHTGHVREIAFPELSDIEMAGKVRMLTTSDWICHEAVVCGARDRILALVKENKEMLDALRELVDFSDRLQHHRHFERSQKAFDTAHELLNRHGG